MLRHGCVVLAVLLAVAVCVPAAVTASTFTECWEEFVSLSNRVHRICGWTVVIASKYANGLQDGGKDFVESASAWTETLQEIASEVDLFCEKLSKTIVTDEANHAKMALMERCTSLMILGIDEAQHGLQVARTGDFTTSRLLFAMSDLRLETIGIALDLISVLEDCRQSP